MFNFEEQSMSATKCFLSTEKQNCPSSDIYPLNFNVVLFFSSSWVVAVNVQTRKRRLPLSLKSMATWKKTSCGYKITGRTDASESFC